MMATRYMHKHIRSYTICILFSRWWRKPYGCMCARMPMLFVYTETHTRACCTRQCLNCECVHTKYKRSSENVKMKTNRRRAKKIKIEITELKHSSAAFRLRIAATECREKNIVIETERKRKTNVWTHRIELRALRAQLNIETNVSVGYPLVRI